MHKYLLLSITLFFALTNSVFAFESKLQGRTNKYGDYEVVYDETISDEEIEKFIFSLKDTILKDNRKAVAKIFNCKKDAPCRWLKPDRIKFIPITSEKMFLENYDQIMTQGVKNAIKRINDISELMVNWRMGFGVERGSILWFTPRYGVSSIISGPSIGSES